MGPSSDECLFSCGLLIPTIADRWGFPKSQFRALELIALEHARGSRRSVAPRVTPSKFQEPFCNASMFNNPGRGFGAGAPIAVGRTKPVRSFAKPR
jgi:hypothetical protein